MYFEIWAPSLTPICRLYAGDTILHIFFTELSFSFFVLRSLCSLYSLSLSLSIMYIINKNKNVALLSIFCLYTATTTTIPKKMAEQCNSFINIDKLHSLQSREREKENNNIYKIKYDFIPCLMCAMWFLLLYGFFTRRPNPVTVCFLSIEFCSDLCI